jgi:glycosyltransferase involved in cell wall biosynthesis
MRARGKVMRVLIPLSQFFPGGQTTHVLTLAKYLRRSGHEVTVLHTRPGGRSQVMVTHYRRALALDGVEVLTAAKDGPSAALDPFRWDVIHAHSTIDWPLAQVQARDNGCPYVLTVHGLGCDRSRFIPILQGASQVIAVGQRAAESVSPHTGELTVIENGIDTEVFQPQQRPERVCLTFAGRLDAPRLPGLRALLDAWRLLGLRSSASLYIVSNPPGEALRESAEHGVVFTSWTPRPDRYINRAWVVIGAGRVIREGMAARAMCLVLGPRYGGVVEPRLLPGAGPHDFSGRGLHLPVPSSRVIAHDIRGLLKTPPEERARLGRETRDYALRHFGAEVFAAKTTEVYRQALGVHCAARDSSA